jgi:hypothetical protein
MKSRFSFQREYDWTDFNDSSFCLAQDGVYKKKIHHMCNGKAECLSGEDEWQIDCGSMVVVPSIRCPREHSFVALDRIADGVVDCPMSYEDELVIFLHKEHLPLFCSSKGLSVLCKGNEHKYLSSLTKLTKSLTLQRFSSNVLNKLQLQSLDMLLMLQLIDGEVKIMNNNSFSNLKFLTVLVMTNGLLDTIHCYALHGLSHLSQLILHHNPLNDLCRESLNSVPNLITLDLSNTLLTYLDPSTFDTNVKMQHLHLSHTLLTSIIPGTFKYNVDLIFLSLAHTKLSNSLPMLFRNNTNLTHLDLNHTLISAIQPGVLQGLPSLQILGLSKTELMPLSSFSSISMFSSLSSLEFVYVVYPEVCCMINDAQCVSDLTSRDIIGTCHNIIASSILRYFLYIYLICNVLFNVMSFVWWITQGGGTQTARCLLACNLNAADLLIASTTAACC